MPRPFLMIPVLIAVLVSACTTSSEPLDTSVPAAPTTTLFTPLGTDPWGLTSAIAGLSPVETVEIMGGGFPPFMLTSNPSGYSPLESEQMTLSEWLAYLVETEQVWRLYDPQDTGMVTDDVEVRWLDGDVESERVWAHVVITHGPQSNDSVEQHILVAGIADAHFAGIIWANSLVGLEAKAMAAAELARNT